MRRFLGDLDAAKDKNFSAHFYETKIAAQLKDNESYIIFGVKGSGKTALRRALTELNSDFYDATKTINLDSISFRMIHAQLAKIRDTVQADLPRLAQNVWSNLLAISALETFANSSSCSAQLKEEINELLLNDQFASKTSTGRLLRFIEDLLEKIGEITTEEKPLLGLPIEKFELVSRFPSYTAMAPLIQKSTNEIIKSGKTVLVCLDGLDSIQDHTKESRQAIFAGLIDAIHKFTKDDLLSRSFCFKAFLPHELAYDAHLKVWDFDKFAYQTKYLGWNSESLKKFIAERLSLYSKSKSPHFADIWSEFFTEKLTNRVHKKEENTFDYILRHTLYRPRQILNHVQNILDAWDQEHNSPKIDPSFIPAVVAQTNQSLSELAVTHMESQYPFIRNFMHSWRGTKNVITVQDFKDKISKFFSSIILADAVMADVIFDDLFNYGVFGYTNFESSPKRSDQTKFTFGFFSNQFPINLHALLGTDAIIALNPMFSEYCGSLPTEEYGIIAPATQEQQ